MVQPANLELNKSGASETLKEGVPVQPDVSVNLAEEIDSALEGISLANGPAENREQASEQGGGQKSASAKKKDDEDAKAYAAKRQALMDAKPKPVQMVNDIRAVLHKQLITLEKEEVVVRSKGIKQIDKYVDVVAKIRHIKRMFARLANASYKALKALWLKVVHGIV